MDPSLQLNKKYQTQFDTDRVYQKCKFHNLWFPGLLWTLFWSEAIILSEDILGDWNSPIERWQPFWKTIFMSNGYFFQVLNSTCFCFFCFLNVFPKMKKSPWWFRFQAHGRKNCHKKDCKMEKIHLEQKMPPSSMFYFPSLIVLLLEGIQFPHKNFFWSHCQWGYEKKMALENLVSCL